MTTNTQTTRAPRGGRDDSWTESATETLISSWGNRYLHLNRGNLRQSDWKQVANAVNSLRDKSKPPRTDVQCKNRIDTLKKKYKAEKCKSSLSKWPFYNRLDYLIGTVSSKKKSVKPNANTSLKEDDECLEKMSASEELAKAIGRFGQVYERVENVMQDEMMEMEKQRLEFVREVELRRVDMFVETRIEIEKVKMLMIKKKKKKMIVSATALLTTGREVVGSDVKTSL